MSSALRDLYGRRLSVFNEVKPCFTILSNLPQSYLPLSLLPNSGLSHSLACLHLISPPPLSFCDTPQQHMTFVILVQHFSSEPSDYALTWHSLLYTFSMSFPDYIMSIYCLPCWSCPQPKSVHDHTSSAFFAGASSHAPRFYRGLLFKV